MPSGASLKPEAYRVLRRLGTEARRAHPYLHLPANAAGLYRCKGCVTEPSAPTTSPRHSFRIEPRNEAMPTHIVAV